MKCPNCGNDGVLRKYGETFVEDEHIFDNTIIYMECPNCGKHTKHYAVDYFSEPNGYKKLLDKLSQEFENVDCVGN